MTTDLAQYQSKFARIAVILGFYVDGCWVVNSTSTDPSLPEKFNKFKQYRRCIRCAVETEIKYSPYCEPCIMAVYKGEEDDINQLHEDDWRWFVVTDKHKLARWTKNLEEFVIKDAATPPKQ
jgi:hypothetical protein